MIGHADIRRVQEWMGHADVRHSRNQAKALALPAAGPSWARLGGMEPERSVGGQLVPVCDL